MSFRGSSPSEARAACPGVQRKTAIRMPILGVRNSQRAPLQSNAHIICDDGRFHESLSRITFQIQHREGRAPIKTMPAKDGPTRQNITGPNDGLLHRESVVFDLALTPISIF